MENKKIPRLWCKKYEIELSQTEIENKNCFRKFVYLNRERVCPCLINLETKEQFYKEIFEVKEKEESTEDILTKTARILAEIKKAGLIIEKKGGVFEA